MMLNVHTLVVAAVVWASLISAVLAFSAADYNNALGKSLLFYDLQRSGRLPRWQRLRWRGNSAMNDGRSQGVSKHTNFSIFNERSGEPIMQITGDDIDLFWMLSFFCFWSSLYRCLQMRSYSVCVFGIGLSGWWCFWSVGRLDRRVL